MSDVIDSPLGLKTKYIDTYTPELLYSIPRAIKRREIGLEKDLPFSGVDIWNAYEVSWLDPTGKPHVAIAEIRFPCESVCVIESKSLKLYLYSLNQTVFPNDTAIVQTIEQDLTQVCGAAVTVCLYQADEIQNLPLQKAPGICIDDIEIETTCYQTHPEFLQTQNEMVSETLYSNLLRSNCLVTKQPDWGTVIIDYTGLKIDRASLLKYVISFRKHIEFHEQCIERIFMDLMKHCKPEKLTVYGRYTRRGGLDINPLRSNCSKHFENFRLSRQ